MKLLKQSKPGTHVQPLVVEAFGNKRLCLVEHLKVYIDKTKNLRNQNRLFITYMKPHRHVARDTISRWIKYVLQQAGVDTTQFSAHSTRSASTSAAAARDIPIDSILKAAGWSGEKTFSRFYHKQVMTKTAQPLRTPTNSDTA